MAQILKEEIRNRIVESAKEEFLKYGYKDASMRRIAQSSGVTVGNLYRYFDSKEAINAYVVGGTLEKIESALKRVTSNSISFKTSVFNLKVDTNELNKMLDAMAEDLVEISYENPVEFKILLFHSEFGEYVYKWFAKLIKYLITQNYPIPSYEEEMEILSRSYAVSIFKGIIEIFRISTIEKERMITMLKVFLRSYVFMLDNDIRRFVG